MSSRTSVKISALFGLMHLSSCGSSTTDNRSPAAGEPSTYGSGSFGRWINDVQALPAYQFDMASLSSDGQWASATSAGVE